MVMPPPPPEPLCIQTKNPQQATKNQQLNRNGLLNQIRQGTNLKKVETCDRSAPVIGNNKAKNGPQPQSAGKPSGPVDLGGLFAQGMPKLCPTEARTQVTNGCLAKGSLVPPTTAINKILPQKLQSSHNNSLTSSPESSSGKYSATNVSEVTKLSENISEYNGLLSREPIPAPPPPSQKPILNSRYSSLINGTSEKEQNHMWQQVSCNIPDEAGPFSKADLKSKQVNRPNSVKPPPFSPSNTSSLIQKYRSQTFPQKPENQHHYHGLATSIAQDSLPFSSSVQHCIQTLKPSQSLLTMQNQAMHNTVEEIMSCKTQGHQETSPQPVPPVRSTPLSSSPDLWPSPPPPITSHPSPPPCITTVTQMKAARIHQPLQTTLPPPPPPPIKSLTLPPTPVTHSSVKTVSFDLAKFEAKFMDNFHILSQLPSPSGFKNITKSYPSKYASKENQIRRQLPPPPPVASLKSSTPILPNSEVLPNPTADF
ncbi:uncharacterized protein LOC143252546 isoform X2 [Tachypleus tridentatus]